MLKFSKISAERIEATLKVMEDILAAERQNKLVLDSIIGKAPENYTFEDVHILSKYHNSKTPVECKYCNGKVNPALGKLFICQKCGGKFQ